MVRKFLEAHRAAGWKGVQTALVVPLRFIYAITCFTAEGRPYRESSIAFGTILYFSSSPGMPGPCGVNIDCEIGFFYNVFTPSQSLL
ncbi:hypothetical protein HDU67_003238 [Dinochytrium kinnereticum]|nr:hypothetical protein HDU67_003238 [Dinochytrium kinnereticum]